jgi:hypothetical protein
VSSKTLPKKPITMETGINYTEIFNEDYYTQQGTYYRGNLQSYHFVSRNSSVLDYRKGAKHIDIKTLKNADKRNFELNSEGFQSKFGIGFEVEKERFQRGAVRPLPLFAGYERDGSCGVEAVTNILPLLPSGLWRNKVYSMMHDARNIIEDMRSPSNTKCGGHITLSCEGITGIELISLVRKFSGIVYAVYRHRLLNGYCRYNIRMASNSVDWKGLYVLNDRKYHVCKVKDDSIEFRLPSRVQSVKQMMRRYELMYELLDFSVNNPNGNFNSFLKKVTPIVKSMYNGDMDKVQEILSLAKSFQRYIDKDIVSDDIKGWLGFESTPS